MRVGTPGFVGERLREAREARGLTAVTLSELIGKHLSRTLTPQAISKYEHNDATPGPEVLQTLAGILNVPLPFFTASVRNRRDIGTIFYRSMAATTKHARIRAEWKLAWLRDLVSCLAQYVSFPSANLPDLRLPENPFMISDPEIEEAAAEARRYWNMSHVAPIGNMIVLLENQGVIVARQQLEADSLDSLSAFDSDDCRPYVIIGTEKGTAVRWRFDAAHELGHLLLHPHVHRKELGKTAEFKKIEEQAHRFAAAFLLPLEPFCEDLFAVSLDAMVAMKPKWKVSVAMMIMRARQAGLISEQREKNLWINRSRRRWGREEPYDRDIPAEEPRLMRRATELVLAEALTVDDLVANVHLSPPDIERLVGLPSGYLLSDTAPVQLLPIQDSSATPSREDLPPAEVIPLPFRPRRK